MHKMGEKFRLVKIKKNEETIRETPEIVKNGIYSRNQLSVKSGSNS
jgi:hypothetical protein